jgi:elongin-B
MQTMYIRVKRDKTTYFIQCDPTETVLNIKQKLHSMIDQPPSDQQLILVATNAVLDDSKTLANQKVPVIKPIIQRSLHVQRFCRAL